jgi:hypothetical protein
MIDEKNASASDFSNPLAGALAMASRGFRVIPCKADKSPIGHWPSKATRDPEKIGRWFEGSSPAPMYGVVADEHTIIDVDVKRGDEWTAHYLDLGALPPTFTVLSPSGGFHKYFTGRSGGRKPAETIDIKTGNGYVIGPGSPGYRVHDATAPAPLPSHVADRLGQPAGKTAASAAPIGELDTLNAIARAARIVAEHPGVDKGNRDNEAFKVACRVKDEGLSEPECVDLMLRFDAEKVDPPLGEAVIREKVSSAYRNGQRPPGSANVDNEFENIAGVPELAAWDRRRSGVPAGALLKHPGDINLAEILARQSAALVKGILAPRDQAVAYGRSTAGKTFGVLDMAWHIAQGREWHGRKVNRAPVLYVCLEGVDGFDKRTEAAKRSHGDPGVWFARLAVHVTLVKAKKGEEGAATIVAAAGELAGKCGQPVGLIVIDTAARATAGDSQNDSETVMAFVESRMGKIVRETGAAVMVVHHTNRAGDIRGALDWRNPMDVVLKWERDEGEDSDQRRCIAEKIKDGPETVLFDFTLEEINLGRDPDGDPVTSCVVRATPHRPKAKPAKERKSARVFRGAWLAVRASKTGDVRLTDVRVQFMDSYPSDGEQDEKKLGTTKRQAWSVVMGALPKGFERFDRDGVEYVRMVGTTSPLDEFEAIKDDV